MSGIYEVCKAFYRAKNEAKSFTTYLMDSKKTYEELNMLLLFSTYVKGQQTQREQTMAVMSFLAGLPPEFETSKSQILSGFDIPSLHDVFSRVLHAENTSCTQQTNVLVEKGEENDSGKRANNKGGGNKAIDRHNNDPSTVVCYYCRESGHTK